MTEPRQRELYFEELGARFDEWMSPYDVQQRCKLILKLLPANSSSVNCLEVGCGTGRISAAIAPLVKQLTVADISERLAQEVGTRLKVAWSKQDACDLRLDSNSFDLVISSECIEHTPAPEQALREMARVLKPGGFVIVTSPNKLWYLVIWLAMAAKLRKFAGNEHWLWPWQCAQILKQCSITDVRVGGCHLFPWQIPLATKILPFFDSFGTILYPIMINYGIRGRKAD